MGQGSLSPCSPCRGRAGHSARVAQRPGNSSYRRPHPAHTPVQACARTLSSCRCRPYRRGGDTPERRSTLRGQSGNSRRSSLGPKAAERRAADVGPKSLVTGMVLCKSQSRPACGDQADVPSFHVGLWALGPSGLDHQRRRRRLSICTCEHRCSCSGRQEAATGHRRNKGSKNRIGHGKPSGTQLGGRATVSLPLSATSAFARPPCPVRQVGEGRRPRRSQGHGAGSALRMRPLRCLPQWLEQFALRPPLFEGPPSLTSQRPLASNG